MSTLVPRLATSKQWTELPADFTSKIRHIFIDQFQVESRHGDFLVEGRIYPEELLVRVGYLENGRLKQINFEASADRPKRTVEEDEDDLRDDVGGAENSTSETMDRLYACIDALGSLLEEYFETDDEDQMDVPLRWKEYDFEGQPIHLQYSTINSRLEDEADRILGLHDKRLVHDEDVVDALNAAEVDTELALEVQKVIRTGKFPHLVDPEALRASDHDENS